MDANVNVSASVDACHVGDSVLPPPTARSAEQRERAGHLHRFLVDHGLYLTNTFSDDVGVHLATRAHWTDEGVPECGHDQVDFIAAPIRVSCAESQVLSGMHFSTDHRMVTADLHITSAPNRRPPCPANRKRDEASAVFNWDRQSWDTTAMAWRDLAHTHAKRKHRQHRDEHLEALLHAHAIGTIEEKKELNRTIYRYRRKRRREAADRRIQEAATTGAFPSDSRKNLTVNWGKLFNGEDPATMIRNRSGMIHGIEYQSQAEAERSQKSHFINLWRDLRIDMVPWRVTETRLRAAIGKLKTGKGSPDGCTAEMYRKLPPTALVSMAVLFSSLLASFNFPAAWVRMMAILLLKVRRPATLGKFRGI